MEHDHGGRLLSPAPLLGLRFVKREVSARAAVQLNPARWLSAKRPKSATGNGPYRAVRYASRVQDSLARR